ncbi:MAG: MarR family winged helix-turn-helix transcriptional regulator [Jhaorihella sp.]
MAEYPATTGPDHIGAISDATLRLFAGYYMKRAFNVVWADLSQTLRPFGLRMLTYSALTLIVDNPGLRQAQLASALAMERPNMAVIIDELDRRDLIRRDRDPTDRRAYALMPTPEGRQLCERATRAVKGHEARLFGFLKDDERAALLRALHRVETGTKGEGA